MILVLGGTSESREITELLVRKGYEVIASTATTYGGALLEHLKTVKVITKRMGEIDLIKLIKEQNIRILIDATHPFAELATTNAQNACKKAGIVYIRYERPDYIIPNNPLVHKVSNYQEAAKKAAELASESIFITTGTKTLPIFAREAGLKNKQIIVRILPDIYGLKLCFELGIPAKNIIAMQGPFSTAMNSAMLADYKADVIVTKDSGIAGGTHSKIEAALSLSIPVVLIERPITVSNAISNSEKLLERIHTYGRNENIENSHSLTQPWQQATGSASNPAED